MTKGPNVTKLKRRSLERCGGVPYLYFISKMSNWHNRPNNVAPDWPEVANQKYGAVVLYRWA